MMKLHSMLYSFIIASDFYFAIEYSPKAPQLVYPLIFYSPCFPFIFKEFFIELY